MKHRANQEHHSYSPICTACNYVRVPPARVKLGYRVCMECGEREARQVRHTVAPMHKSNYVLVTDTNDLKGFNNKGGLVK